MRSVSSESSDMGVASISSTEARDDDNVPPAGVTRQHSGWRRHMSETNSADGEGDESRHAHAPRGDGGAKGAFL